jgi:hypothetical protein
MFVCENKKEPPKKNRFGELPLESGEEEYKGPDG